MVFYLHLRIAWLDKKSMHMHVYDMGKCTLHSYMSTTRRIATTMKTTTITMAYHHSRNQLFHIIKKHQKAPLVTQRLQWTTATRDTSPGQGPLVSGF